MQELLDESIVMLAASSSATASHAWLTTSNVIALVATALLIKSHWSSMPEWIKRSGGEDGDASDDLANPTAIVGKLKEMMAMAAEACDQAIPDDLSSVQIMAACYSLLHLHKEMYAMDPDYRDRDYDQQGANDDVPLAELELLTNYLEYAEWAYEESHTAMALKCKAQGLDLIQHDTATEPGRVGHYIALNHAQKLAIIGLKGTSTLGDVLTDLIALPKQHTCAFDDDLFSRANGGAAMVCHEGIHTSAIWMADNIQPMMEHLLLPLSYKVVLVGHSLGAGCACLLGLELRARIAQFRSNYDDLRVFAYGSPPVISYAASKACAPFVTSVVNNADIIPRSSLSNMVVMNKLLRIVNDKLKAKGLAPTSWESLKQFYNDVTSIDGDLLLTATQLDQFFQETHAAPDKEDQALFVPGRVVVLWDKGENDSNAVGGIVTDCGMKMLRQIDLSSTVVQDHGVASHRTNMTKLMDQLHHKAV